MPNNVARRGRGSFNPNSRKASRHERKKDNNNSDNSGSDGENTVQQKRFRTISEQAMDEDIVADTAAGVEVEGPSSPPKENNTVSTSPSSHPNMAAALSAPNDNASYGLNASMHARTTTPASPPNASPDKANDDDPLVDQLLVQSPTFSIDRNDFQAAAAPNSAPETLKNFTTNKALIDAVNNTFLEMYESYTGKARMTGSGDAKRLVIHFQSKEARDACVGAAHQQFPDLVFHAHDPRQLRSDEDLRAIQVTDIPFFLTKDNIMSYFKKFGNIASCRVYSRKNAKVQQARIVYDSALSIARFDSQWAVYCFSTCLRVTPCHYMVDQKSSRREFVATLTQLPPNTKDIDLAPLTRDLGAKAVNVPLSLNSYKPKRWAYVTFNSQETMDAAMEQIIGFRGHTLQWNLPNNTNKLCHRCGKLGCAPTQCPSRQERGRSRRRNPVAALKERPNNSQPSQPPPKSLTNTCIIADSRRDRSKSNDKCDRSVSFSTVLRTPPFLSSPNQAITMSPKEAADILTLLKSLQQDMAEVRDRITALELNDHRMTRIEQHLGLLPPPDIPTTNQSSDMLVDALLIPNPTVALVSSRPAASPVQTPLNPLSPGFTPSRPVRAPLSAPVDIPDSSSLSSTFRTVPSSTQTRDEIQAINEKHSAIENKLDMLANSISGFIGSITSSSSSNSANSAGSN
ncbi:hypothetical protein RclHR1_14510002 [Rhizophagus clarus]|uniref:RRM domain-containing protein n=2 Tax=Rhizophagus clarus TaxID=94130 RepID=A0A2Z6QEL3_9GLOM|nr:hypothetical protein RclHR1_14510002 [Rhizophagus clarus]